MTSAAPGYAAGSAAAQKRRRQRRPELQSETTLPEDLKERIQQTQDRLTALADSVSGEEAVVKTLHTIGAHLNTLRAAATTPDKQLQAIPRITEALRDGKVLSSAEGESAAVVTAKQRLVALLLESLVFPFLLDCRVRYLHRGLTTLVRTAYPSGLPQESFDSLREVLSRKVIQNWPAHDGRPCLFPHHLSDVVNMTAATDLADGERRIQTEAYNEDVLLFLNTVDALGGTLMPYAPTLFYETFLEVLPLLGDSLQWSVANAISRRRRLTSTTAPQPSSEEETDAAGTVFGEDLEHIRFCVRVVASYTHKYTDRLTAVWNEESHAHRTPAFTSAVSALSRIMEASVFMLCSDSFPKDVLNAAGLLVANTLTVRTCNMHLIFAACDSVYQKGSFEDLVARSQEGAAAGLGTAIHLVMGRLCSAEASITEAKADAAAHLSAMRSVFGSLSCNGAFAFFKGLLAHFSSPIRGDICSIGLLLAPVPVSSGARTEEEEEGSRGAGELSIALDRIVPLAQQASGAVEMPEVRFMAIQTVDCVVRYIAYVLTECSELLGRQIGGDAGQGEASIGGSSKRARKEVSRSETAAATATTLTSSGDAENGKPAEMAEVEAQIRFFADICQPSAKLLQFLDGATRLVMGLWDDGTQQMSGPLYETYDRVLRVNHLLSTIAERLAILGFSVPASLPSVAPSSSEAENGTTTGVAALPAQGLHRVSMAEVLAGVLAVQNERRGKYHALLSLLGAMPLDAFLDVVSRHCEGTAPRTGPNGGVTGLARMLLGGASNHKVANIAGDVFAKLVSLVYKAWQSGGEKKAVYGELLHTSLLDTLALAIGERAYIPVVSNVSESISISNTMAHFVYPLLKQNREFLPLLMNALLATRNGAAEAHSKHNDTRRKQGVVELLSRARSSGIDIAVYLQRGTPSFRVIQESLQSANWDVRRIAFNLCVHSSKKIEPVLPWQCTVMEDFLALNMNLGGDTTARKELVTIFRLWVERLADSYKGVKGNLTKLKKAAKQELPEDKAQDWDTLTKYCQLVQGHWTRLAALLSSHYGVSVEQARGFAVERRAAALTLYSLFLSTNANVMTANPAAEAEERERFQALFNPGMVAPLVADLSDGWSVLQNLAKDVLRLFLRFAPVSSLTAVLPPGEAAQTEAQAVSYEEITTAQTYRGAEGAVSRFMLLLTRATSDGCVEASEEMLYKRLSTELAQLGAQTEALKALQRASAGSVASATGADGATKLMGRKAVYDWLQSNPLHGRISLCTELLSEAHRMAKKAGSANSDGGHHVAACNTVLARTCEVIQLCGSLVGGTNNSTKDGGAEGTPGGAGVAPDNNREVVDCRGHVYDRENPEAESIMRRVVNNTWLGIRVATLAMHRVLKVAPIDALSLDQVRQVSYELMEALLLTKHNGVMRCVRGALKAVTEALVRCRDARFYNLPGEMLAHLLGGDGVMSNDFYRMLRRSQGLPHALLAVLEAEDPSVPFILFPIAMKRLLRIARGDHEVNGSAPEPVLPVGGNNETIRESQRSNALNVLKFIFEDKIFADRSLAYIEEAFSLSTEGFNNDSWYIRNSSLMLYASVLHRFVGEHPAMGGAGVNTSLHDIAKRTPRGVAFALRALTDGDSPVPRGPASLKDGEETNQASSTDEGTSGIPQPNLALFPILQMLSMLAPDPAHRVARATGAVGPDDSTAMIEAVLRCGRSANLMIRSASAVALSCLVPTDFACDTIQRVADEQLAVTQGVGLPGMNSLHGTLLQLLQFHTVYVGTLRRHRRLHRLSSATNEKLSLAVGRRLASVLVRAHSQLLRRACLVCPTVAATLLTLLHDLIYFGCALWPTTADTDAQQLLGETILFATQLAEEVCAVTQLDAAATDTALAETQRPILHADIGHAREAAALVLAVTARVVATCLPGSSGGAEAKRLTEVKESICRTVAAETAVLSLTAGHHNVLSWMLDHMQYYTNAKATPVPGTVAFFGGRGQEDALGLVKTMEGWRTNHGIRAASLVALTKLFAVSAKGKEQLGCVAWGEVVAHLEFAVLQAQEHDPVAESQHTILQAELIRHVTPGENTDGTATGFLVNSDAQSLVIRYLASRASQLPSGAVPAGLVDLLSHYALPDQPVACREAVVASLGYLLSDPVKAAEVVKMGGGEQRRVGLLVLVLMRLLFDDLTAIREGACEVCAQFFAGAEGSHVVAGDEEAVEAVVNTSIQAGCMTRDVMSNALSLVLFVRALGDRVISPNDLRQYFTLEDVTNDADVARETDGLVDEDDGGDGEEMLFDKEADNMFIEASLLSYLVERMRNATVETDGASTDIHCPNFSVFDALIETAEANHSFLPLITT